MKNWLRKGILYGTALAALAGCGIDSRSSVGPEARESRINSVEEASSRIRSRARNPELEQRVNDALGRMNSARKPAQSEIITVDFDAKIADYNHDHAVDFDDFFGFADVFGTENGEYNLVGNNFIDFDDFFAFADNFGKTFNKRPKLVSLESSKGDTVNVGEEIVLSGVAQDVENDSIDYKWSVKNDPVEVNGSILRRTFNEAGEYPIALRVSDFLGGQSNEMSRTLNVRYSGPVLSLPDEISFSQWISGQTKGNIYELNLDDYVSDPNFSDTELTWKADDSSVENNQFTFWPRLPFWFEYTEKALHLERDGNELVINPVANFSGGRYVNFTVTNPDGRTASKRVRLNVIRTPEFDDWYNDVVTGGGWNGPPKYFYIWTGNGRSEEGEWPLSQGKGPKPTQEEIDYFVRIAGMVPEVSDFFKPLEIRYTDNWDEWLNNRDNGAVLAYIDNYAWNGGTTLSSARDYSWTEIGINSANKTDRFYPVGLHEMLDHGVGMDHPENDRDELFYVTIFSGGNRLDYIPARDKAVVDSFYETKKY